MLTETELAELQALIDDVNAGRAKPGDLLAAQYPRLEGMARKRLNDEFGRLRDRGIETGDILQEAVAKFLQRVDREGGLDRLKTVQDFFFMTANYLRWTLIDTANRFRQSAVRIGPGGEEEPAVELSGETKHPFGMDAMTAFHEVVERLSSELKAVFDLIFYHELTYAQTAQCLGITSDMVKHRFAAAKDQLRRDMDR